jgi:hypothetical protein
VWMICQGRGVGAEGCQNEPVLLVIYEHSHQLAGDSIGACLALNMAHAMCIEHISTIPLCEATAGMRAYSHLCLVACNQLK